MTSQELEKIKDLRDYAELAWASYSTGLRNGMFGADSKGDRDEITDKEYEKLPTYFQALHIDSALWEVWEDDYKVGFSAKQTYKFIERYKVVYHHIDDWKNFSGFSATIFYDIKESNTTTNTKESEKRFEYIIAFRDTESTREIV